LLELLEYLVDWITTAPVLLVAVARPELLDNRPEWMAGKTNATLLRLEPLTDSAADGLISNLIAGSQLVEAARGRIAQVAEGNPLFLEETLRMLVDDGLLRPVEGGWSVTGDLSSIAIPPTIHALLTARLDRLEPEERAVIERASVIGRQFGWGAVTDLTREDLRVRVGRHLQSLTHKELIRPDHSELAGEDIYRFTHILVQDAAYAGIPKATQAELHERLANRLAENVTNQAGEYEEIIGYHLEQAHRSLTALGSVTERIDALGARAASLLASAGRRANAREDAPAAVGLLARAAALLPRSDPERVDVSSRLFFALMDKGEFDRIPPVLANAGEVAEASGDPRLRAHVSILELWMRFFTDPGAWTKEAPAEAGEAISVFDRDHDERGLTKAWAVLGLLHVMEAKFGPAEEAWEKAAIHAHRADERRDELEALSWVLLSVWAGPSPAEKALERCTDVLERSRGDRKGTSSALFMRAVLEAGIGNVDEARQLIGHARSLLEEVGHTVWMAGPLAQMAGLVELLADDPAAAERELRWGYETLQEVGEMAWLPTLVGLLAEAVYRQGRYEEAERFATSSERTAGSEDAYSQVLWRSVKAKVLAREGSAEEAEALIEESVALAEGTDSLQLRGEALLGRAEVLKLSERGSDARRSLEDAVQLFEQKGNRVAADRARGQMQELAT
jgi:tetratricopeptide (TPR) repeat protein